MVILWDEIICNKINQGLSYIPGDLVIAKHARLWIFGMTISGSEFIISHKPQKPMKMQKRRVVAWRNWVARTLGANELQEKWIRVVLRCWGEKFCQTKMETQSCEYGFIFKRNNGIYDAYRDVINLKDD